MSDDIAAHRRQRRLQMAQLCDELELGWAAGAAPALEDLLGRAAPEDHPDLFRQLLPIERDQRQRQGRPLSLTDARGRFGRLGPWVEEALLALGLSDADETLTLEVEEGPGVGRSLRLAGRSHFLVGRGPGAHLMLEGDPLLSRVHFGVEYNHPFARLTDMRSRHGTFLNGRRVESADLSDGDRIRAGGTVLRVVMPGTPTLGSGPAGGPETQGLGPVPAPPTPLPGVLPRLPGYTVEAEVGQGGMGRVYRARREADGLRVAVKTILPAVAPRPELLARFQREIAILGQLEHPGIVRYLASGEHRGMLYFVMEYVDGTDLGRAVKHGGPMEPARAARLAGQVLDALAFAHDRGFVHRDIKPGNLLLSGAGAGAASESEVVKLADFGLARAYEASAMSGLTQSGESGGTPGFMPPEQVLDFRGARPAADQYSVAATLYYLLTGRMVYEATKGRVEMLVQIVQTEPIPLRPGGCDGLPAGLAGVIRRALAREPRARYPDARAMRAALVGG